MRKRFIGWGAAAAGLALFSAPAGANILQSCPDGVSVNMVIVDGVVDGGAIIECLGEPVPTPVPTPTPIGGGPTPTPGPTSSPTGGPADCANTQLCPNGCLTEPILGGFGVNRLRIDEGVTRTYCAPVMPPYVNGTLSQVKFQFYDESDKDCARLVMSVDQTTGARMNQTTGSPLPNGNILYRSAWGPFNFPERTAHGMYRITVQGHGGCATTFRVGWGVN